jgi:hypothetical protein
MINIATMTYTSSPEAYQLGVRSDWMKDSCKARTKEVVITFCIYYACKVVINVNVSYLPI